MSRFEEILIPDGNDTAQGTVADAAVAAGAAGTISAKLRRVTAQLNALLTELQLKADLTETQPVSAASLPLPAGAATSAKQLADNHNVSMATQDSNAVDAFGRLRVSQPFNTFDIQFTYDLNPLFFEEIPTGGGDVTHVAASSAARLTTGGTTSGHGVVFQTQEYFRYQPGKSQFVVFTTILGSKTADVRKRIGYFDAENGFFFEQDGSNLKIVRRTKTSGSIVDNAVNQSSWNLDVLDGNGASGITLDETKDNIYVIDFQWLGAGRIRFGFDFGGHITYVHQIKFANTETVPFTVTGDLPFRAEIFNTDTAGGTTTFDFTCAGIASEGGFDPLGIPGSVQSTALRNVTTGNDPLPIISIRPRVTMNSITYRGAIVPKSVDIMSEDATVRYELVLNGSLTGASFADVDTTNSGVQVDVAATAIAGGLVIDNGFLTGSKDKNESGHVGEDLLSKLFLSNDVAGTTPDILTIAISIINSAGTASDCGGSFTWKEER